LENGSQGKEVLGRIKNKDDGDHEDVDMGFAEFPLRAIHGENPTVSRLRRKDEDQRPDAPYVRVE
jgi:hypothetical protein